MELQHPKEGMLREVRLLTRCRRSLARAGLPGFVHPCRRGLTGRNSECRQDYRDRASARKRRKVGCSIHPFQPSCWNVAQQLSCRSLLLFPRLANAGGTTGSAPVEGREVGCSNHPLVFGRDGAVTVLPLFVAGCLRERMPAGIHWDLVVRIHHARLSKPGGNSRKILSLPDTIENGRMYTGLHGRRSPRCGCRKA